MFRIKQGGPVQAGGIVDRIRSLTGTGNRAVSAQSVIEEFEAEARAAAAGADPSPEAWAQPGDETGYHPEPRDGADAQHGYYEGTETAPEHYPHDAGSYEAGHYADGQSDGGPYHEPYHDAHQDQAYAPLEMNPDTAAPAAPARPAGLLGRLRGFGRKAPAPEPGGSEDITFDKGVVLFGKKAAAIGLNWITSGDSSIKELARGIDQGVPPDISSDPIRYNLYADTSNGFVGFGSTDLGQARGMPALVTAVSSEFVGARWIGAFQMAGADTWWIGSMRNGQVYEDKIIRGETAARDALLVELAAPDWVTVFAPAIWNIPGASQRNLPDLTNFKEATRLSYVAPIRAYMPRIILGSVLAAITIGGITWYGDMKRREMEELEALRRQAESKTTISITDYPYHQMTRVVDAVKACEAEIQRTIILVPGWETQPIACNISTGGIGRIEAGWTRARGSLATLVAALPPGGPVPVLSSDGVVASYTAEFTLPFDAESGNDQPWTEELITRRLRERFTTYGLDIVIQPTASNMAEAMTVPVFNSTDLHLTSQISLQNYGDILSDVPALAPQAVVYNVSTGNWDLIMLAYHPALVPAPQPVMPN